MLYIEAALRTRTNEVLSETPGSSCTAPETDARMLLALHGQGSYVSTLAGIREQWLGFERCLLLRTVRLQACVPVYVW